MTLDHKCQIFQNLNGAVGEKLIQFPPNLYNIFKSCTGPNFLFCKLKKRKKTWALNNSLH